MTNATNQARGFTLVEILLSLAIGAILLTALADVVAQSLHAGDRIQRQQQLATEARFALRRMVNAVGVTPRLLLPSPDLPGTGWSEHIREQTIPPSAPESGSVWASAVLAVTLSHSVDLNGDGVADADNDGDGRIDEDLPDDIHLDYASGIKGIDDDGDGYVDEAHSHNDDEFGALNNEDWVNGQDDDADGSVDEDPPSDMNADGCPGICGVDDDGDGTVDEGSDTDDDEDGGTQEDCLDPVVFHLVAGELVERTPVPWDTTADSVVDGRDYVVSTIAENVTRFRVERIPPVGGGPVQIDLTLVLADPRTGQTFSLQTRVRVGGAL
ncbi:MAG: prepilin-type N-terminal cleavage/methylation domain-containing protein [Gammaproteobacteria bacterium]|nr:prepilin-type N-terminal cleavage/methylation domain-containing protein [Gammaproteobacteria bacterium]